MISDACPTDFKIDTPQAYCCTATGKLMEDPVLALCGHLFEKCVVEDGSFLCPCDKKKVTDYVACKELKERIKKDYPPIKKGKATKERVAVVIKSPTFPKLIKNAHSDDIHGMIKLPTGEIITGSKDASIKVWDVNGSNTLTIGGAKGYRYWITALAPLSDGSWISGTRDGYLSHWSSTSDQLAQWRYNPSSEARKNTYSKTRNKPRICCVVEAKGYDKAMHVYTGTLRYIQLWNVQTQKLVKFFKSHDNDWVYCIDPLTANTMLVVTGPKLEKWTLEGGRRFKRVSIIEEKKSLPRQPQYIAAISRLQGYPHLLAAASFDGSIKVVDFERASIVKNYKEHKGRAWCIANVNSRFFATGADDKIIRIWDHRMDNSAGHIKEHPGRVSTLLKYDENFILAGSCPDDPYKSKDKGQLNLWDLRRSS